MAVVSYFRTGLKYKSSRHYNDNQKKALKMYFNVKVASANQI